MTQDEFLAWQERQDRLYELVDGVPVLPLKMMTGASQAHDRVVVNIIASLAPRIDLLSRNTNGGWNRSSHDGIRARVDLPTIQASLALFEVFEGLEFNQPADHGKPGQ
jgi:hypothetical protein